jgi:hypothetical protein
MSITDSGCVKTQNPEARGVLSFSHSFWIHLRSRFSHGSVPADCPACPRVRGWFRDRDIACGTLKTIRLTAVTPKVNRGFCIKYPRTCPTVSIRSRSPSACRGEFLKNANKLTINSASNVKVLSRTCVPIENAGRLGTWNNRGCRPVQKPQRIRQFRPLSFRPGIPAFPGRSPVSGSEISFFLNVPRVELRVRLLSAPFSKSTSGKEGFEKSPMERRFRLKPLFPMLPFRSSLT